MMQVVFYIAMQTTNIASIVISNQVMDDLLISVFGYTCGLSIGANSGMYCVTQSSASASPFGSEPMIFHWRLHSLTADDGANGLHGSDRKRPYTGRLLRHSDGYSCGVVYHLLHPRLFVWQRPGLWDRLFGRCRLGALQLCFPYSGPFLGQHETT